MSYQKPIPLKTLDNSPYWDAADQHELRLQKCMSCGEYAHPPGPSCAKCGGTELSWETFGSDVKGTIYSYVISYRPFLPGFQDDLPLVIAQVELENPSGVKILGNVIESNHEEIKIGKPVQMVWVDITEDRALPQWKLL
ncbi:hypothetical protein SAMN05192533_108158 [Mesobacillus persicus]|uniref:DUF35 domain-containing protein n=1 Tax=Mesobacillus persicus TaxID=930146 RepID=A0A1H8DBQ1_9BACI|nr:OB-fold domain-containing protein [Mesobacillus persicus]SEN04703.1 hypothetical protein SAMN05192533_108158 [Mesobacillus persicus]